MQNKRGYFNSSGDFFSALPNLTEVQIKSYQSFLKEGLKELLEEVSPIEDFTGKNLALSFLDYKFEDPPYDENTARIKNLTYKAPLKVRASLLIKPTGEIKESEVFLGDFPMMTQRGTFIINGVERVVVSQIVRSYGILFVCENGPNNRKLFGAKVIPLRGAWLEFETSAKDVISVKIDRKRRLPVTTFLKALKGFSDQEILELFADVDNNEEHRYIAATLAKDTAKNQEEALVEVYRRIRPGDIATPESARIFLEALFFHPKRFDLGKVGRYKINQRLNLDTPNTAENRVFKIEDLIEIIKELIRLNNDPLAEPDDIDSLKNRRIRAVGELVQNKVRVGFLRLERIVRDRMAVADLSSVTPNQLVNARPIAAVLQEFFASSQLSQFMNQPNPVAEIEHKRTLCATGPGGLSRERAGFDVRDVHTSHYGRICPVETPEGPNIGLVGFLATYARINEYGFIETPYRKVIHENGKAKVSKEIVWLDAAQEERAIIAPASTKVSEDGYIVEKKLIVRKYGEPKIESVEKIEYIDVSPMQTIAVSTSLIPFIEHDDAVRSSMGANMMKQAVPVLKPEAPIVGTGMEAIVAQSSGHLIVAPEDGEIIEATADSITLLTKNNEKKTFRLQKFVRSNQATCIDQRLRCKTGDKVKKGDILADSNSTDDGELALGQNLLVGFLSWYGANYEDAIILSERLVRDDIFSSIHIEKYSIEVRETKLGPELITRDIPNVSEEALANLDEMGIVQIGAEVEAEDILVGKISPKGETEPTAEERLLRAIFGEKAKDVRDSSLRLPYGEKGKVVDVRIFDKEKGDELPAGVNQVVEVWVAQLRKISVGDKLAGRHGNKGVISVIVPVEDMPFLEDGTPLDIILNPLGVISRMNLGQIMETILGWAADKLNYKVASPVFQGVSLSEIAQELEKAGLPKDARVTLYDGFSGLPFAEKVTVGKIYMLKLNHLVDDKVHARSIGPYSMVTQQPLGGKAQFGGQRFGEMEVWALEAYGAAHTLQEMLTIKSDDVVGRSKAYEAIIKGEPIQKPSIPASFNVLVKELQSLALSVRLYKAEDGKLLPLKDETLEHAKRIRNVVAASQAREPSREEADLLDELEEMEPAVEIESLSDKEAEENKESEEKPSQEVESFI